MLKCPKCGYVNEGEYGFSTDKKLGDKLSKKDEEDFLKMRDKMFSKSVRVENRRTFKAYDGLNNLFNLGYDVLSWKVHKALINAKLEPYLGFLHSEQFGKPSLVCDFMELYRYLIDDFLIQYCQKLKLKDFIAKTETWNNKTSKRIYLNNDLTKDLTAKLQDYFRCMVRIPRIMRGEKQELETLISEEALLFAKYLRNERAEWIPRIVALFQNEPRCHIEDCFRRHIC